MWKTVYRMRIDAKLNWRQECHFNEFGVLVCIYARIKESEPFFSCIFKLKNLR